MKIFDVEMLFPAPIYCQCIRLEAVNKDQAATLGRAHAALKKWGKVKTIAVKEVEI